MEKRSRNFTDFDKNLLVDLVLDNKNLIENKQTNALNNNLKDNCWDNITLKYNASAVSGIRSKKQLKELYNILKRCAKKKMNDDRQECYKTGGGTYDTKCTEIDLKIINILKDNFMPDDNPFDSSADLFGEDYCKPIDLDRAGPSTAVIDCALIEVSSLPEPSHTTSVEQNNYETPKTSNERVTKAPVIQLKKRKYLNEITDAFVNRKSKKNKQDDLQLNNKMIILNSQKEHKIKKLEQSEMLFNKEMEILELDKNCKLEQIDILKLEKQKKMEILELEKQIKEAESKKQMEILELEKQKKMEILELEKQIKEAESKKQMEILELEKQKKMEILELEKQIKEAELKIKLRELQKHT